MLPTQPPLIRQPSFFFFFRLHAVNFLLGIFYLCRALINPFFFFSWCFFFFFAYFSYRRRVRFSTLRANTRRILKTSQRPILLLTCKNSLVSYLRSTHNNYIHAYSEAVFVLFPLHPLLPGFSYFSRELLFVLFSLLLFAFSLALPLRHSRTQPTNAFLPSNR